MVIIPPLVHEPYVQYVNRMEKHHPKMIAVYETKRVEMNVHTQTFEQILMQKKVKPIQKQKAVAKKEMDVETVKKKLTRKGQYIDQVV